MQQPFCPVLRSLYEPETLLMIYNVLENSIVNLTIYCILENVY